MTNFQEPMKKEICDKFSGTDRVVVIYAMCKENPKGYSDLYYFTVNYYDCTHKMFYKIQIAWKGCWIDTSYCNSNMYAPEKWATKFKFHKTVDRENNNKGEYVSHYLLGPIDLPPHK